MYQYTKHGGVLRLSDGAVIPPDPRNADFTAYSDWFDAGGRPAPAEPVDASEVARSALAALEQASIMNRGMRELCLVVMQDMAQRQSEQMAELGIDIPPQTILAKHSFWRKLIALNAEAGQLLDRIK